MNCGGTCAFSNRVCFLYLTQIVAQQKSLVILPLLMSGVFARAINKLIARNQYWGDSCVLQRRKYIHWRTDILFSFPPACLGFFHRLEGSTTFTNNKANRAAGIFNPLDLYYDTFEETNGREYRLPAIAFPDDTIFEDNRANVSLRSVWVFVACTPISLEDYSSFALSYVRV